MYSLSPKYTEPRSITHVTQVHTRNVLAFRNYCFHFSILVVYNNYTYSFDLWTYFQCHI